MVNVSSTFLQKLYNDERNYLIKIEMILADETELELTNEHIWQGSFSVDDSVGSDGSFSALGAAIVNSCKFTLNNIYDDFSEYDFTDAVATVYVGLPDCINGQPEYAKKGVFTVNEAKYNGSTIALTLYDNMHKFDRSYGLSDLEYPTAGNTLDTIVRDACTVCGVTLATSSLNFPRKSYVVYNAPESESTTFREVLSWCATIAGCFARVNNDGELELKWFDTTAFDTTDDLDGGYFDTASQQSYTSGDSADGGSFNPWNTGDEHDGGTFAFESYHIISSLYSQDIAVDDVVITQIQAEIKAKSNSASGTTLVYTSGTDGYSIDISNNDFLTESNTQSIVDYLATQFIGMTFRKVDVSHSSNPTIEAGDVAFVYDRKQNRYQILVTRTVFTVGAAQKTICGADTPLRNSAARFSESTKSYVELRKRLIAQQNSFEAAEAALSARIDAANGLYETAVTQPDQSVITYLHNKPELSESVIQIMISSVGVLVTANGTATTPTWYGLTVDGQLIAAILQVIGINASWINTGQLVIKDSNNQEMFFADADTGVVRIKAAQFSLSTGETIQDIADASAATAKQEAITSAVATAASDATSKANSALSDAKDYTDLQLGNYQSTVSVILENLQDQIDGQVDTYYYAYAPTTSNEPAATWITNHTEAEHNGDIFCDTTTDFCYRWLQDNGVWGWEQITDTLASQALARANDAYTMADNKRRVFIVQPTPPYESGDLWMQGSTGDILVCKDNVSRSSGDSYVAADWILGSKYTDDTAVNNMVIGGRNLVLATGTGKTTDVTSSEYTGYYYFSTYGYNKLSGNTTDSLTVSFDYAVSGVTASGANTPNIYPQINGAMGNAPSINVSNASESGHYTGTFKLSSTQASVSGEDSWRIRFRLRYASAGTLTVSNVKVEKGTKETTWTVAPEDVAAEITTAISDLQTSLESQIDAKIQTWTKSSDPASAWSTDSDKHNHLGDLWYYTGESTSSYTNNCTYQYVYQNSQYKWVSYSTSTDLFDAIDGKTTIYYGTTSGTYTGVQEGDYLVDGTSGNTYRWSTTVSPNTWVKLTDYVAAITTAVNNIVIGGKNLLRGTEAPVKDANVKLSSSGTSIDTDGNIVLSPASSAVYARWMTNYLDYDEFKDSEYTFSLEAMITDPEDTSLGSGRIVMYVGVILASRVNNITMSSSYDRYISTVFDNITEAGWHKYYFTVDVPDGLNTGKTAALVAGSKLTAQVGNAGGYRPIKIRHLQLEKGNKATDWSPAPEDIQTTLDNFIDNTYAQALADVNTQLDLKAETWYQVSDPSTNWTAAEKTEHTHDLWYNPTNGTTSYWDGSAWQAQSVPDSVFDAIDGKAQIFVAQPVPPYSVGDLWVQGSTGDILRCSTAKASGQSYSSGDWVLASKYTDDTALQNMVIGGRNLLLLTEASKTTSTSTYYTEYWQFSKFGYMQMRGNTTDDITLSFDYACTGVTGDNPRIVAEINSSIGNAPYVSVDNASQSGHYVATFKLDSTQANVNGESSWRFRVGLLYATAGRVAISHVMLERSTKQSAWTIAPEDVANAIESVYDDVIQTLEPQIDAKIETWSRATDPALQWNTDALKSQHVGDLWCYTGETTATYTNGATYQYQENEGEYSWADFSATDALFDAIDGKTTVYYGSVDGTYNNVQDGDYLVDGNTGTTYRWDALLDEPTWVKETDYNTEIRGVYDEITAVRTDFEQRIDGVEITVVQTTNNLDELKTHYRFDADGEEIGKSDSNKSIKLSNDGIKMMVDGETVTKWNQDEMYTPRKITVPTNGSLQLGDFIFQPRSSGNISLFFIGD